MTDSTKVVRYGRDEMVQHEATANGTVTAGYLLERTGSGEVAHHSTDAGTPTQILVAKAARGRGMELGDDYADGNDGVKFLACSGGGVNLHLATGENVSEGDPLVSAGDGTLRAAAGDNSEESGYVAVAAEDLDNSDGDDPAPIATDVVN